jgi:hypothetical protein
MQTLFIRNTCFAAVAAVTIVVFTGLMLDRSLERTYESALPKGTVEICELQPVQAQMAQTASHGDAQR